jgi:Tfp pilus assembly protein PilF
MPLKTKRRTAMPILLAVCAVSLLCVSRAAAQADQMPIVIGPTGTNPADGKVQKSAVNIYVSVREANGLPVSESASVKLSCPLTGIALSGPSKNTALVQFFNIPAGDCNVDVSAAGYKSSRERTSIEESLVSRNQYVYVYLHPESEATSPSARSAVSLDVLKEIDKSLEAMNKNHLDDSRKHLNKAAAIAPQNPDVQYLLGMVEYRQNNLDAARLKFEGVVSHYPTHEHSLIALGELQLKSNQFAEAEQTLQKALAVNRAEWRTHLLLANAYAGQAAYEKAESEARSAANLSKENAAVANAFLAQILAAEGTRDASNQQSRSAIREHSLEAATPVATAPAARALIAEAFTTESVATPDRSPATSGAPATVKAAEITPLSIAPISPSAMRSTWAPPDIDSSVPGVAADVTCSEAEIVDRASKASLDQLQNFEKFLATEHIEHQEIDAHGTPGRTKKRDFTYLAFVEHAKDGQVFLDERRDGGTGLDEFPTSLATTGLLGLGVDVFHPGFSSALQFRCEGLGQWQGKPAWLVHFEQRPGQRSYLRVWQTRKATVEVPLKGRVWVAASSYEVLHIESDLREPIKELELTRDHLVIDYGPVNFEHGATQLWLPWYADMYLELHGKRYHHRHTLTNYALFSVDTTHQISAPKQN